MSPEVPLSDKDKDKTKKEHVCFDCEKGGGRGKPKCKRNVILLAERTCDGRLSANHQPSTQTLRALIAYRMVANRVHIGDCVPRFRMFPYNAENGLLTQLVLGLGKAQKAGMTDWIAKVSASSGPLDRVAFDVGRQYLAACELGTPRAALARHRCCARHLGSRARCAACTASYCAQRRGRRDRPPSMGTHRFQREGGLVR